MSGKLWKHIEVLQSHKAKLIDILSSDADFVLQHADSRFLLSPQGYKQIKACRNPSEKVTDLLDHVISRGPDAAHGLLELLKDKELQENFPMLDFIKNVQVNTQSSGRTNHLCSHLVTEKQLMTVARATGRSWREIGILALDIPSVKLDEIMEDHSRHVERVFEMLRCWRNRQRDEATAARLHSLLSHEDLALPKDSIDFLLETS
uniref:Zgc:174906 n=1 Tax=Sphaeramia orbicularis TaxID=375764 RepID=A0A673BQB2_9TELE